MTDDAEARRRKARRLIFLVLLTLGTSAAYRSFRKPEAPIPAPRSVRAPEIVEATPVVQPTLQSFPPCPLAVRMAPLPAPDVAPKDANRFGVMQGAVYLPDGKPARLAKVDLFVSAPGMKDAHIRCDTDEKGRFRLEWQNQSQVLVTAHLPGYGRSVATVPLVGVEAVLDFGIHLQAESVAVGVVQNPDGSPHAGARLRFRVSTMGLTADPRGDWNILLGLTLPGLVLLDAEAASGNSGEFRAPSLMPGAEYTVEVIRKDREMVRIPFKAWIKDTPPVAFRLPD